MIQTEALGIIQLMIMQPGVNLMGERRMFVFTAMSISISHYNPPIEAQSLNRSF
jgi:hypothetical protein